LPLNPISAERNEQKRWPEQNSRIENRTNIIAYREAAGLGLRAPLPFVDVKHS